MNQKYTNHKRFSIIKIWLDETLAWLSQKTEESKCNKAKTLLPFLPTHTVNAIEL